jgi:tetratricopeptide (TPR) repeat protein
LKSANKNLSSYCYPTALIIDFQLKRIKMKTLLAFLTLVTIFICCKTQKNDEQIKSEVAQIDLSRGDIALCGSGQFGQVDFGLSCKESVQADFNLATALLHSFEYAEAEKVFARVIDSDPQCIMAYWGVAMSNFHPLWAPPTPEQLAKGSQVVALARSLDVGSERERKYVEAIATIFDGWEKLDHKTRLNKFEDAAKVIYEQYPDDTEAAIFYALALRASADPTDKTFVKQKKAGEILTKAFAEKPDHPGVAHYLIHTYDYPELAELGLTAARKYASIASASAHAQHMPSHIFTRLGLWDESIQSNINSMAAAKCYAEKLGTPGHWDQELHGLDYLVYAYLQQGKDDKAREQVEYLNTISEVFPVSFVDAYTFVSVPVRYALERKDWKQAAALELRPANFPWDKFLWEKAIFHFGRLLGSANVHHYKDADLQLTELKGIFTALETSKNAYEAKQVQIQITASEGFMQYVQGKKTEGLQSLNTAAEMEDATEKHSVTPGEVVPARELLAEVYLMDGNYAKAIENFEANLKKRPHRFNSVYGVAVAAKKSGDQTRARAYFQQVIELAGSDGTRPEVKEAAAYLQHS